MVKFKDTDSKLRVKNSLKHVDLKQSSYAVFDQLPKEVQDRRKEIPHTKNVRCPQERQNSSAR